MDADIQLTGGKELAALLEQLPDKIADRVMGGALYAGASVVRDDMRANAPILDIESGGGPHEPGTLLRSIQARRSRSRSRNEIRANVIILQEAFYWRFVEFGTRHAPAHPFARPAFDRAGGQAAQAVVDYAATRLETEALK